MPLKASLKTSGLLLDVDVANAHIGRWLHETANQRIHATTQEKPAVRLQQEQDKFMPLPQSDTGSSTVPVAAEHVMLYESLQHPLSVYDQLLGVS